jgi:hypothetical protein
MNWFERHLSDEALLLVDDGELPPRRRVRARAHLDGCQVCRARLAGIEHTLARLSETQRADDGRPLPPANLARARLARRIAEDLTQGASPRARFPVQDWLADRRWLYGAAAALVALATGLMVIGQRRPFAVTPADAGGVFLLPRPDLTPGAAAPVALHDICGDDRYGRTQPIVVAVHQAVFARYGAEYRRAAEYELDYLITPELGGVADPRNLWPQPFARTPWNAYVKDELERLLHQRVCDRSLELAVAQRELAADWISAYKRHFKTSVPLRDYVANPLTALDHELILSELEELGVSAPAATRHDGPVLMAMLQMAKGFRPGPPRMTIPWEPSSSR